MGIGGQASLDEHLAVEIGSQILDGLEHLHSFEPPIVYRDLKPSNAIVDRAGTVKLVDFGIARHFQSESAGTVIGTQGYAPPEQYRGKSEIRSDLYSLGATLHQAISGRDPALEPPFSFPPLQTLSPECNKRLCSIIDSSLSYDLEARPKSAAEFRRELCASLAPSGKALLAQLLNEFGDKAQIADKISGLRTSLRTPRPFCSVCGARLDVDSDTCARCGTARWNLSLPSNAASESTTVKLEPRKPSATSRNLPFTMIGLSGVVLAIGFLIAITTYVVKKDEPTKDLSNPGSTESAEPAASKPAPSEADRMRRESELVLKAHTTPPSDYEANLKIYRELSELRPENELYSKKVTQYEESLADASADRWNLSEDRSAMDDSENVGLTLIANEPVHEWIDTYTPVLVINCREKRTNAYIDVGTPSQPEYGEYNTHRVRVRLDKREARLETWSESTDGKALFSPNPISFSKQLETAKILTFEFTPFNAAPATTTFDLRGLSNHLGRVFQACHRSE